MKSLLILVSTVLLCSTSSCPRPHYRSYFSNVTHYRYDLRKAKKTPGAVRYFAPSKDDNEDFRFRLDALTSELELCLQPHWVVRRDWFVVLVPDDWYMSACSQEQLVPSTPSCKLCQEQKKLPLPDKCCGLRLPTKECPCVCNMRAVVQDNYVVVTAPNLKLYKAELARLVTNVNNVWAVPNIRKCL